MKKASSGKRRMVVFLLLVLTVMPEISQAASHGVPASWDEKERKAIDFANDPTIGHRYRGTPAEFAANRRNGLEKEAAALRSGTLPEQERLRVIRRFALISDDIQRGLSWNEPVMRITLPRLKSAPIIDGKFSPGEWAPAYEFTGEYPLNRREKSSNRSDSCWRIAIHADTIYIACSFTDTTPAVYHHMGFESEKNPMYQGDVLEFFLRPSLASPVYYECLVNPEGKIWVLQHRNDPCGCWKRLEDYCATNVRCGVLKHENGYQIELAVPLHDFRKTPQRQQLFSSGNAFSFMLVHADRSDKNYFRGTPVPLLYDGHNIFGYCIAYPISEEKR